MNQKTLLIVGGSLVGAAFLLGFVPQLLKKRDLSSQLEATRQELTLQRDRLRMDDLGLLIGSVYLQINLKNYGLARQYATKFFDGVRAMADETTDANRRTLLQSALAKRDEVTGGLAKGDPSTVAAAQDLFQRMLDASQMR